MSAPAPLFTQAQIAIAIAILVIGAGLTLTADNAVKRMIGVAALVLAPVLAAAALGGDASMSLVFLMIGISQLAIGCVLVVRLQETYGSVETPDIEAADADVDVDERRA